MDSQSSWALAFALVAPLLIPIMGTMLMVTLVARKRLKAEQSRAFALVKTASGRRIK